MTCNCAAYEFPHREKGGRCVMSIPVKTTDSKPPCSECKHGTIVRDPYGVGSLFPGERLRAVIECTLDYCPWNGD